jgi:uncharacterized membrane protein
MAAQRGEELPPGRDRLMKRLAYIDWMRGLACVLMFQTHCYDSWLNPEARQSALFAWSRLGGTLPAPLFIFLAGISIALVTEKSREKGIGRDEIARHAIMRGAEIFGLGMLFRIQEYVLGFPYSPWTDLFRVDILNELGISMMLMGGVCWLAGKGCVAATRIKSIVGAIISACIVALATPLLWTTARPKFLPWPFESYINGVHTFNEPQPWLFPVFPWIAFAFGGMAIGFWMFTNTAKKLNGGAFAMLGGAGIVICGISVLLDGLPFHWFGTYDYWHTSPNFFLMRCGVLLVILLFAYGWCRWGLPKRMFSPLAQLGKTSLLVYWVHIEFVYGRFSILPKGRCSIAKASFGLAVIFLAMLGLSVFRTRWKRSKAGAATGAAQLQCAPAS